MSWGVKVGGERGNYRAHHLPKAPALSPMKYQPSGPAADRVSERIELSHTTESKRSRPGAAVSLLTPLDPLRQAKRLPIRLIKMLTAHTGHLLHPEYLQPLTSAPVSIEVFIDFFFFFNDLQMVRFWTASLCVFSRRRRGN